MSESAGFTYLFDSFSLNIAGADPARIKLQRDGHAVNLNTAQSKILQMLVENHGQVVKKHVLLQHVCGTTDADRNLVEKPIHDLRVIFADPKEEGRVIRTEGSGYRFVASVQKLSEPRAVATGSLQNNSSIKEGSSLIADRGSSPTVREGSSLTADMRGISPTVREGSFVAEKTGMSTFESWMGGPGKLFTALLFVLVLLTLAISITLSFGQTGKAKWSASLAQFLVIVIAFAHSFVLRRPRGFSPIKQDREDDIRRAGFENFQDFDRGKENPRAALEQYTKYWRWLLLSWLCLYAFFAITGLKGLEVDTLIANPDQSKKTLGFMLSIFNTLFNNWNTLMIILCFYVLNKQVKDEGENREATEISRAAPLAGLVLILLGVTFIEFLFVAPIDKSFIPKGASLVSGIAGGIAMALYVGRLQSKFLGPRPWLLIALYSYTAIQPLFVYLEKSTVWTVLLIDLALILKCLLYLYMAWLFQSGLLLFYFVRMRRTYRAVGTQWNAFRTLLEQES